MISVLDTGSSNFNSVVCGLNRLGLQYKTVNSAEGVAQSEKLIFPGVGHASSVIKNLKSKEIDQALKNLTVPVLGICLGMQLLFEFSEEGLVEGLGLIEGKVCELKPSSNFLVPHMGWNQVEVLSPDPLFKDVSERDFFYFAHSFYAPVSSNTVSQVKGAPEGVSAGVRKKNFWAVQFHPEISGVSGSKIFKNFEAL